MEKIEVNKNLVNEPNGFKKIKIEINDSFVAVTFIDKGNEAISFQKNFSENGFVLHVIGGYINKKGSFISEGNLETVEPLDVSKIVEGIMKSTNKRVATS
jgi:hypothetical protein